MRIRLVSILLLATMPLHAQTPANASVHQQCEAHADALLRALDEAHFDAATADFDTALRARYTAAQLKQDYQALPATYGKALGRGRAHTGDIGGHTVVLEPLIYEHGTLTAEIHCDAEGAVADLRLTPTQRMGEP